MADIGTLLKQEIRRLAARESHSQTESLRRAATVQRKQASRMRGQVAELEKQLASLQKELTAVKRAMPTP